MLPVYAFMARHVAEKLAIPTELVVGSSYAEVAERADVAFVCSLAYIEFVRDSSGPVEPIVAPVLR